jgi:hypothetical protein
MVETAVVIPSHQATNNLEIVATQHDGVVTYSKLLTDMMYEIEFLIQ